VLWTTLLFAVAADRVDRHRKFNVLLAAVKQRCSRPHIGSLDVLEPSWVFYSRQPIDRLFIPAKRKNVPKDALLLGRPRTKDWQEKPLVNAWRYLARGPDHFMITSDRVLAQLKPVPPQVEVLAETSYFLRRQRLVLLRWQVAGTAGQRVAQTEGCPEVSSH
jgi:hypothetical protein